MPKLDLKESDLRDYLIRLAKQRKTCGYKELAEDIAGKGSYIRGNYPGRYIGHVAGEVSKAEARENRPLLSVLIINQSKKLPGEGFFKLAKGLGLFQGDIENIADMRAYTEIEKIRVYDFWTTELTEEDYQQVSKLNDKYIISKSLEVKERLVKQIERGRAGDKVKALNGYKCQLCEALSLPPLGFLKKKSNIPYVEAHHAEPVSSLAPDVLHPSNIIILCANHHRQIHFGNIDPDDNQTTSTSFAFIVDGKAVTIPRIVLSKD
jgi:hypothetical protein